MHYGEIPFEERLKENIRQYRSADLYDLQIVGWQLRQLCEQYGFELLLTDRHGEKAVEIGAFEEFEPDVVKNPGEKIQIKGHTVGHIYIRGAEEAVRPRIEEALHMYVRMLEAWGEKSYLARELSTYCDELADRVEAGRQQLKGDERKDVLTGTLNKTYFENRMKIIDRAEIAPVALIQANINDWKFFHDHFGIEESDRLISVVAGIIREHAREDYVIGRCAGDLFNIIIPMPQEQEAEEFVERIRRALDEYDDPILVPSAAFGIVYKENVEESLEDKLSDAEYEMFNDKIRIKNMPDYRERLEKGIG
mgnify:FL=1